MLIASGVAFGSALSLDDPTSPYTEARYAGLRLAECLTDALRVAESRGMRLPAPDTEHAHVHRDEQPRSTPETASGSRSGWPRPCWPAGTDRATARLLSQAICQALSSSPGP
ncbi:hypothetical protein [Streptomyces ureilyticus]|uniref:Uncharacterized protein n=1 Tax=Streptomyces ureilyticus TaxID=1775131 RepID=A0ABX0E4C8_9ACTN|nr:hypothetical protein [Streptomyces ureilyticus]NGO45992.1 hypothetical protein [Streptomyces ureilyticus]